MKGSPRSVWLSMTNRAASQAFGFWSGVFTAAAKRNQAAMLNAMTKLPKAKTRSKTTRTPKKKGH
ncbi:hypothetical protein [Azospirillum canadense]|uniref:hypothetical protein n=1 Tax=Azospirillum canadense TaxID=403962 RepID=UPI002227B31D|nr:hypothetical protein [Azospirillum canadense]MCW2238343.1 hypothetical protein [Azospirillum canadense]